MIDTCPPNDRVDTLRSETHSHKVNTQHMSNLKALCGRKLTRRHMWVRSSHFFCLFMHHFGFPQGDFYFWICPCECLFLFSACEVCPVFAPVLSYRPDLREQNLWNSKSKVLQIWRLCECDMRSTTCGLSLGLFSEDLCLKRRCGRGLVLIHICEMSPPHRGI